MNWRIKQFLWESWWTDRLHAVCNAVWYFKASNSRREETKQNKNASSACYHIFFKNLHFCFFSPFKKMALKKLFFFFLLLLSLIVQLCNNLVGGLAMTAGPHGMLDLMESRHIFFNFLNYKKMLQLVALDYPSNLFRHFLAIYLQTFIRFFSYK